MLPAEQVISTEKNLKDDPLEDNRRTARHSSQKKARCGFTMRACGQACLRLFLGEQGADDLYLVTLLGKRYRE